MFQRLLVNCNESCPSSNSFSSSRVNSISNRAIKIEWKWEMLHSLIEEWKTKKLKQKRKKHQTLCAIEIDRSQEGIAYIKKKLLMMIAFPKSVSERAEKPKFMDRTEAVRFEYSKNLFRWVNVLKNILNSIIRCKNYVAHYLSLSHGLNDCSACAANILALVLLFQNYNKTKKLCVFGVSDRMSVCSVCLSIGTLRLFVCFVRSYAYSHLPSNWCVN